MSFGSFDSKRAKRPEDLSPLVELKLNKKRSVWNPYKALKIYQDDDPIYGKVEFFEHLPLIKIPPHQLDSIYVVTGEDESRMDVISYKAYGSVLYWWAILAAQDPPIFDAFQELLSGTLLRIPYLPALMARTFK